MLFHIFFLTEDMSTILGLFTFLHNSKFHEAESNKTDHYSTNLPQYFPLVRIFPCINTNSIFILLENLPFIQHEKFEMIRILTELEVHSNSCSTPKFTTILILSFVDNCFIHPIFLSFGFWYFGHFSCMIIFLFFSRLAHLALQNVNKDYVIFSYFRNFIAKSDQKPKTKMG